MEAKVLAGSKFQTPIIVPIVLFFVLISGRIALAELDSGTPEAFRACTGKNIFEAAVILCQLNYLRFLNRRVDNYL